MRSTEIKRTAENYNLQFWCVDWVWSGGYYREVSYSWVLRYEMCGAARSPALNKEISVINMILQLCRLSLNIWIHSRSFPSKSRFKHYATRYTKWTVKSVDDKMVFNWDTMVHITKEILPETGTLLWMHCFNIASTFLRNSEAYVSCVLVVVCELW